MRALPPFWAPAPPSSIAGRGIWNTPARARPPTCNVPVKGSANATRSGTAARAPVEPTAGAVDEGPTRRRCSCPQDAWAAKSPTPPYWSSVRPPVHQAGLARATGLPETAFTAALTAPQLVGQSRAGLGEARRTVTHDARVST